MATAVGSSAQGPECAPRILDEVAKEKQSPDWRKQKMAEDLNSFQLPHVNRCYPSAHGDHLEREKQVWLPEM